MKIFFMTRRFPPSVGGMENFAFDLFTALSKKIDIVLVKWGKETKSLPLILPYFLFAGFSSLVKHRKRIDIIHAQDGVLAPLGWLFSKLFRKPYIVVIHGLDITFTNKLFQTVVPWAVKRAEVVFCISQAAADEVVKRGCDPAKIKVIPLGITDEIFASKTEGRNKITKEWNLANDAAIILTLGRLVERKGVAWFVENCMPLLVERIPQIVYLVAGSGGEEEKIRNIIEQKNLSEHVKLLGRVSDDMMAALYNGADVFVQPNIPVAGDMEGFGKVLLEASLCELPVVASGIEGIKDAITNGSNGVLVNTKDAQAFVDEIAGFLSNPKKAEQFGKASRQFSLGKFDWATIAEEYVIEYQKIVSAK